MENGESCDKLGNEYGMLEHEDAIYVSKVPDERFQLLGKSLPEACLSMFGRGGGGGLAG